MPIEQAIYFFKGGGAPKPPPPPLPPSPSSAADNAAKMYRDGQRRRATGFSQTILTSGMNPPDVPSGKTLLGG